MLSRRIFINSTQKVSHGSRAYSSTINSNLQQIKDAIIEKSNSISMSISSLNEDIKKMHQDVTILRNGKADDVKILEVSDVLTKIKAQNEQLVADINTRLIQARSVNQEPRVPKNPAHAAFLEYFEKQSRSYYARAELNEEYLWAAVYHNDVDMVNYVLSLKDVKLYTNPLIIAVACGYEDVTRSLLAAWPYNEKKTLYTRYGSMLKFIHQTTPKPNFNIVSETDVKVVLEFKNQQ